MHWRLSEASAIGVVGASQIEVAPNAPARGAHWQMTSSQAVPPVAAWQIAAVTPKPAHSSRPQEVYSRQGDLIVRYGQEDSDQFSYQLDWRLLELSAPFAAAIELWLSVQTDLLDTQPELEIACRAAPGMSWSFFEHHQLASDIHGADSESPASNAQCAASRPAAKLDDTKLDDTKLDDTDSPQLTEVPCGPAALLCSLPVGVDGAVAQGLWLIEPTDQRHARRCSDDDQAEQRVRLFGHFMEKGVIRRARMRFLLATGLDSQAAITREQVIAAYRDFANSPLPLTA